MDRSTNRVFCFVEGINLAAQNGFFRQAATVLGRVRELAPDNLAARLWLGQIYVLSRQPDRALEALREPLEQPEKFSLAKTNLTDLNIIAATAYFQKNDLARGHPIGRKPKLPAIRLTTGCATPPCRFM